MSFADVNADNNAGPSQGSVAALFGGSNRCMIGNIAVRLAYAFSVAA